MTSEDAGEKTKGLILQCRGPRRLWASAEMAEGSKDRVGERRGGDRGHMRYSKLNDKKGKERKRQLED